MSTEAELRAAREELLQSDATNLDQVQLQRCNDGCAHSVTGMVVPRMPRTCIHGCFSQTDYPTRYAGPIIHPGLLCCAQIVVSQKAEMEKQAQLWADERTRLLSQVQTRYGLSAVLTACIRSHGNPLHVWVAESLCLRWQNCNRHSLPQSQPRRKIPSPWRHGASLSCT